MTLSAPVSLSAQHVPDSFFCGVASLDDWLKKRAYANQIGGASRTYVVTEDQTIIGYYCLVSGALMLNDAPAAIRRNMPDPLPMAIIGRLAVDLSCHGKGLGAGLLQDAVVRAIQANKILAVRGIIVQAISEEAKAFYQYHGFLASPTQPMTLILSLKGIE
jgi:predicted GNAT family N-acyltransferase